MSALVTLAAFLVPLADRPGQAVAWAQEAGQLTIARLQVSLWPEYDDPRLLVLYRGQFAETQVFPREISFRIPGTAQVNATAYMDEDGRLLANPFEVQVEGDEQVVTYLIPKPSFHFEFYDDVIQGEPSDREFSFTLSLPYPVQSLQVDVQEPLRAMGFQVSPVASRVVTATDGFRYFTYDLGSLEPGQSVQITASYAKPDARPSVEAAPAQVAPTPLPAVEGLGTREAQPLLVLAALGLGGVGVALMAGALLMRRRSMRPAPPRQPAARRAALVPELNSGASAAAFCTQCGHRLPPGARFCPQCGAVARPRGAVARPRGAVAPLRGMPARALDDETPGEPTAADETLSFGAQVSSDLLTLQVSRRVLGILLVVLLVLLALALGWWLGHQTAARSAGWVGGALACYHALGGTSVL